MEAAGNLLRKQLQAIAVEPREELIASLEIFIKELFHWNSTINLTAIRSIPEAIEKHIIDSLTLLPFLPHGTKLLDAGSGAGFPGIPLKIWRPDLTVFSVEASGKKVYFQREVVRKLKIHDFYPLPFRLENLDSAYPDMPLVDAVVSRALGRAQDLARLAAKYLRVGGTLLLMKGAEGEQEVASWQERGTGFYLENIHQLTLPDSGTPRKILIFRKG